jgi:hypothetical protein
VSRRVPKLSRQDDRVRHISVDLLGSTDELASSLDKAGAQGVTHALFYAYIAKDDERELIDVNRKLFQNVSAWRSPLHFVREPDTGLCSLWTRSLVRPRSSTSSCCRQDTSVSSTRGVWAVRTDTTMTLILLQSMESTRAAISWRRSLSEKTHPCTKEKTSTLFKRTCSSLMRLDTSITGSFRGPTLSSARPR